MARRGSVRFSLYVVTCLCFTAIQTNAMEIPSNEFPVIEREEVNIHSVRTVHRASRPEHGNYFSALQDISAPVSAQEVRLIGASDVPVERFSFVVRVVALDDTGAEVVPCAGALLTSNYVVTTARCVVDATAVRVKAGNVTSPQVRHGNKIVYPTFYRNTLENDIALIQLSTPFVIAGMIGTVKLPQNAWGVNTPALSEKSVLVYSFNYNGTNATSVQRVGMVVQSSYRCDSQMRLSYYRPANSHSCLDTEGGVVGMCMNDWGGPVTYKSPSDPSPVLVGVLSDFVSCGTPTPNVFTRIAPFLQWIRNYVPHSAN